MIVSNSQSAPLYSRMNDYSVQYFKLFDIGYDRMIDQIKNSEQQMAYEETQNPGKGYMIGYGWVTPQQMQAIRERKLLEIFAEANARRIKKELKQQTKTQKIRNQNTAIKIPPHYGNYNKFLPKFGQIIENKLATAERFNGTYRFQYVDLSESKFELKQGLEIVFRNNIFESVFFKKIKSLSAINLEEYDFNPAKEDSLPPCRLFKITFFGSDLKSSDYSHLVAFPCLPYVKVN